jgi:glycosyltransferase involved in cell wall biosynthesis
MRVCVNVESRFLRTPDGEVWASGTSTYQFWQRYLDIFDEVRVISRVADVSTIPEGTWRRANGEAVTFHAVPYYVGPAQYAKRCFAVAASIRKAVAAEDAIVLRVPSLIAVHLEKQLIPSRPFGLEVLGDVNQVFAPGSIKHPLRPVFRWHFTRQLKRQCRKACATAYVAEMLRRYYPPRNGTFSTTYSSIELGETAFAPGPRSFSPSSRSARVISVGTLEVLYKGFDVLMDAVSACAATGLQLELVIVGDGRCRSELERHAQVRGIERQVRFAGRVPSGEAVRQELDNADLFVLASKTEGLPRAMIEAMARGLPCIGSDAGGIPELLPAEDVVPRGDAPALAARIREVIDNPERMARMSARNLAKAREYHTSVLTGRRREFFAYVKEATRQWNERRIAPPPDTAEDAKACRIKA